MARIGQNPMRWTTDVRVPEKITVTVLVHIPFLSGYWEGSLEVLEVCLRSLRSSTELPFDLMIFDNGSCVEVQDFLVDLKRNGAIQFLTLSDENIGKSGAWNILFSTAPGEIVAYSDCDVLYLPGWLESSLDVLRTFPKAGMVTARPVKGRPRYYDLNSVTLSESSEDPSIVTEEGELIPQKYLLAHRYGLGDSAISYRERLKRNNYPDVRLSKGGHSAFVSADHIQFITTGRIVRQLLPFETGRAYGDVQQLDARVNDAGYWRLSTCDYLVHHMGNTLPNERDGYDQLGQLLPDDLFTEGTAARQQKVIRIVRNPILRFLLGRHRIKQLLKRLNARSYELLVADRTSL